MPDTPSRSWLGWAVLAAILAGIWVAYARILDAPQVFDDASIWSDLARRIPSLGWEALRTASAEVHHEPHRWLTNATFALNFYFYGEGTRSFHVTNVAIHCAVTVFVFGFTRETLRLAGRSPESAFPVAVLTAGLFAFDPIQTQAVTYIWQRATELVALFSLGSMWLLAAALSRRGPTRVGLVAASLLLVPLAMISKQNGVMTPVMMALYVWLFASERRLRTLAWAAGGIVVTASILFYFVAPLWLGSNDPRDVMSWNWSSPGAFLRHLMTQARMVFELASLLVLPLPSRLNIDHYVVASSSLVSPWTTLLSIAANIALVVGAFSTARRRPLLALGILWWYVMLVTETTLLRLGPIYEYRAYLPGVGPFLLISLLIERVATGSARRVRVVGATAIALLVLLATGTAIRNEIFTSRFALWEDAARKAPENPRTWWNLGAAWEEEGSRWPPTNHARNEAWNRAEESYRHALRIDPNDTFYRHGLARFLQFRGGDALHQPAAGDAEPVVILEVRRPRGRIPRIDDATADVINDALWSALRRADPAIRLTATKTELPDSPDERATFGYSLQVYTLAQRVIPIGEITEVHCEMGGTIRTWDADGKIETTARARSRGANDPDAIFRTKRECLTSATSSLASYGVVAMINRLAWFDQNYGAEFPPGARHHAD